ncbi:hypothetical protein, partial [Clavibacter phaseoli]|uniref:hypothetical protein n=1 Tax=Clavibacter phaseoli TaxID=1734031 RepID=UPI002174ED70
MATRDGVAPIPCTTCGEVVGAGLAVGTGAADAGGLAESAPGTGSAGAHPARTASGISAPASTAARRARRAG